MATKLNFTNTVSIARFKAVNTVSAISIIKNPATDKKFFTCPDDSSLSGKIAEEIDLNLPLYISDCTNPDTGETFRMLHNRADNSANVVATL